MAKCITERKYEMKMNSTLNEEWRTLLYICLTLTSSSIANEARLARAIIRAFGVDAVSVKVAITDPSRTLVKVYDAHAHE